MSKYKKPTGQIIVEAIGTMVIVACLYFKKFELAALIIIMNNVVSVRYLLIEQLRIMSEGRQIIEQKKQDIIIEEDEQ